MSIAIDMPLPYVEQARTLAEQQGMTLSEFFVSTVLAVLKKEQGASCPSDAQDLDFVADWGRFRMKENELDLTRDNARIREIDFG